MPNLLERKTLSAATTSPKGAALVEFEACGDASLATSGGYPFVPLKSRRAVIAANQSTSNTAAVLLVAFSDVRPRTIASGDDRSTQGVLDVVQARYVDAVRADLQSRPASEHAKEGILNVARIIALTLLAARRIRFAVFEEDEGALSLVVHSQVTKRQVTFEVSATGDFVDIVEIDENMRRTSRSVPIDDAKNLRGSVAWMKSAA